MYRRLTDEHGVDIDLLMSHADNLLYRFTNVRLADTVARVGKDTIRKLSNNDRLVGALKRCEKHDLACEYICLGIALGMMFAPSDDERSIELNALAKEQGPKAVLEKYCEYNGKMADYICELYDTLNSGKDIKEVIDCIIKKIGEKTPKVRKNLWGVFI